MQLSRLYSVLCMIACATLSAHARVSPPIYTVSFVSVSKQYVVPAFPIQEYAMPTRSYTKRKSDGKVGTLYPFGKYPEYIMHSTSVMNRMADYDVPMSDIEAMDYIPARMQRMPPPHTWVPVGDGTDIYWFLGILSLIYAVIRAYRVHTNSRGLGISCQL